MIPDRITRKEYFKHMLYITAKRSTCGRNKVSALIVRDNRIISTGYNGPASGQAHCNDLDCDIRNKCTRSVHAEANAIAFAAKHGLSTQGTILYTLISPCEDCCRLIVNAGIKEVHYLEEYRKTEHLKLYDIHFYNMSERS